MSTNSKKVLIGISGGVDSSTSAYILKEKGFDVTGMFLIMSDESIKIIDEAQKVADALNIKLVLKDMRELFKEKVIDPFMQEYKKGLTPNPCTKCNPNIKFKAMLDYVKENNINYIATGHYADCVKINERYTIKSPVAKNKDQSYMLYGLTQEVLSRLIFPLANYEKNEVREIAKKAGLFTADKPESQDICFVKGQKYSEYIEERLGKSEKGFFISPNGKIVGEHNGIIHYTVGQRKGLGVALGKPCFIKEIDPKTNNIYLAFEGENLTDHIYVNFINYTLIDNLKDEMEVTVKLRSSAKPVKTKIKKINDDKIIAEFKEKQKKPSAGQIAVFYYDDLVICGGIIVNNI